MGHQQCREWKIDSYAVHTPQIISRFGLDGVDIRRDQLKTVIHEVMHMALDLAVTNESKVVAHAPASSRAAAIRFAPAGLA